MTPTRRRIVATAALVPALLLAACSSSTTGSGITSTSGAAASSPSDSGAPSATDITPILAPSTSFDGGGSSSPATNDPASSSPMPAPTSGAFPAGVSALATDLQRGSDSIHSAHLTLSERTPAGGFAGSGDEILDHGKVRSFDLGESVGKAGRLHFRIVDNRVFAQVPKAIFPASKPWIELTANSKSTVLRTLYTTVQASLQSGSSASATTFVAAASKVTFRGTTQFDGTTLGHYSIAVSTAKLPATFGSKQALRSTGLKSIPVELYIDSAGRPRKLTEDLSVAGQRIGVLFTLTRINQPVSIPVPPAGQIEQT